MSAIFLNIDHIVLSGFDLTPGRARRIKGLLEQELQQTLERGELADCLVNREVSDPTVPAMHPAEMQSDIQLAGTLAQRISSALHGVS